MYLLFTEVEKLFVCGCRLRKVFCEVDSIQYRIVEGDAMRQKRRQIKIRWRVIMHCCCQVASVAPDSVRPHRQQLTRLPCPWDSPGKNTGVGCHFLLQCVKVKSLSRVRLQRPHGLQPTRLLRPWDLPSKSTGVGCHCLL